MIKTIGLLMMLVGIFTLGYFSNDYFDLTQCPSMNCGKTVCEKTECTTVTNNITYSECTSDEVEIECKRDDFITILKNVADERDYVRGVYDCKHFSAELASRLKKEGWQAETIRTHINCDASWVKEPELCKKGGGGHVIVKVDDVYLEATSGKIIFPKEYDDYNVGG